jgi:hypothetical protein
MNHIKLDDLTVGKIKEITDPQNTSEHILSWEVDSTATPGIFDKLVNAMNSNIKIQYDEGRIRDNDYAGVYLGALQVVMSESVKFILSKEMLEKQINLLMQQRETENANTMKASNEAESVAKRNMQTDIETVMKEYQLQVLLPLEQRKGLKQIEIMDEDKLVKKYQRDTLLIDEHKKNEQQLELLEAQIAQQTNEANYTEARRRLALASRVDNLMLEAMKSQNDQIATVAAGGLVPHTKDFSAANAMRTNVWVRAQKAIDLNNEIVNTTNLNLREATITNAAVTFEAALGYKVATKDDFGNTDSSTPPPSGS